MELTGRAEAERLLGIAEKLLKEKDLNAARDFALLALETEPLLDGSDQIVAIADVLIAADKWISDDHHHWYAILQIEIQRNDDDELIKQQYRRLALLLHPDKNKFPFAGSAFKLVGDAWSVLSDPSKKIAYDEELFDFLKVDQDTVRNRKETEIQNQREKIPVRRNSAKEGAAEIPSSENIWTPCPYCYNLYEYPRVFEGCCLRCTNCDRAFQVVAIPSESMPPKVPGKEAYYCSWANWMPARSPTQLTSWPSADSSPKVSAVPLAESGEGFVRETPPESRPTPQPQELQTSLTAAATVPRKRGMDQISRTRWSNEALKLFLESCIDEITNVGRRGSSLRKESWAKLAKKMDDEYHMKLSQKQLKNQYDHLKARHSAWSYLKNRAGNIWDHKTNKFNLSNQEWDEFAKGHRRLKTLKNAPLLFPELCSTLFDDIFASDERASSPSTSFTRYKASSSSFNSHIQTLELEDDQEENDEGASETVPAQNNPNIQCSQSALSFPMPNQDKPNVNKPSTNPSNMEGTSETPSQARHRPKKKSKKDNKLNGLIEEATTALKSITDIQSKTLTMDACVDKLNTLDLDEMDPLYCAAFLIFAHSTLQQEFWLRLPSKAELLKRWLATTARSLGFLE